MRAAPDPAIGWVKFPVGAKVKLVGGAFPPAVDTNMGNVQLLTTITISQIFGWKSCVDSPKAVF